MMPYWLTEEECKAVETVAAVVSHPGVRKVVLNVQEACTEMDKGVWLIAHVRALAGLFRVLAARLDKAADREGACERTEENGEAATR